MLDRILEVNPVIGTKRPRVVKSTHHHVDRKSAQILSRWPGGGRPLGRPVGRSPRPRACDGEGCWRSDGRMSTLTGLVRVERSVTQVKQERIYVTPKNHERRVVAVDVHTLDSLRTWRRRQMTERLAWGEAYDTDQDLVFTWEDGRAVLPGYVTRTFASLTDRSASPRLKLHELRHTHATLLLRDDVPVHVVAKRLGHKDPSVTLNTYADAIPDDDDRAVDAFARAVWGG